MMESMRVESQWKGKTKVYNPCWVTFPVTKHIFERSVDWSGFKNGYHKGVHVKKIGIVCTNYDNYSRLMGIFSLTMYKIFIRTPGLMWKITTSSTYLNLLIISYEPHVFASYEKWTIVVRRTSNH